MANLNINHLVGINDPHEELDRLNKRIILLKEETARLMKERKNINLAADWEEWDEKEHD